MRLDAFIAQNGLAKSREYAQKLIESGLVTVNSKIVTKSSYFISEDGSDDVKITGELFPYVSRGGLKLKEALDKFDIDVKGKICIDIGSSTGGFTDCLLQNGARHVYCVDCGTNQLDITLRQREDITLYENFNARYLESSMVKSPCDIATMDVSFISQEKLYEPITRVISEGSVLISLIKPQFECGTAGLSKGGIVKDAAIHRIVLSKVLLCADKSGFVPCGLIRSPIAGGDGNQEFIAYFKYSKDKREQSDDFIKSLIKSLF
ncbi:MAG: TlyA family RNA methyltransferase [Clostridia bacterium]|nr:TlyA family RNA methyltransferase [Clostridia bacterium]